MISRRLRVGSTFSGVGGADLGLERAGFDIAWMCESDEWKRGILAAHWPEVPIYKDVCDVCAEARGDAVVGISPEQQHSGEEARGRHEPRGIDLLVGGFPCQDLSVAGKRRGFDGERSVLAFEFLRIAESLRPRWLLMENVPGLLSSNRGRDFARLIDEVVGIGYGVAWRVLDARYFGIPQRRRRVFIVARRTDPQHDPRAAAKLALRALWEGSSGDPTPGWPPRQNTPTSLGESTSSGRNVGVMGDVSHTLTKAAGKLSSEDGTGRGVPIITGINGDADNTIVGTLTNRYSEQSGQDMGGGVGVIATSTTPPLASQPGVKTPRQAR